MLLPDWLIPPSKTMFSCKVLIPLRWTEVCTSRKGVGEDRASRLMPKNVLMHLSLVTKGGKCSVSAIDNG